MGEYQPEARGGGAAAAVAGACEMRGASFRPRCRSILTDQSCLWPLTLITASVPKSDVAQRQFEINNDMEIPLSYKGGLNFPDRLARQVCQPLSVRTNDLFCDVISAFQNLGKLVASARQNGFLFCETFGRK